MSLNTIETHFKESQLILKEFSTEENFRKIQATGEALVSALKNDKKIISCGNGGSMCDAMHFAEELSGRYREDRKALPAIAISDPSYISCVSNDYGYQQVFSRFIQAMGHKGDVLLAISTSGNSENILKAIQKAKEKKMFVVGLTGKNGGKMAEICDIEIRAPKSSFADRAQEIHIKIIHSLIDYIEKKVC